MPTQVQAAWQVKAMLPGRRPCNLGFEMQKVYLYLRAFDPLFLHGCSAGVEVKVPSRAGRGSEVLIPSIELNTATVPQRK